MTDPLSKVTQYGYDAINRKISQTLPDPDGAGSLTSPVTTFTYDQNGNLLSRTDPGSNTTAYTYDNLNRLLTDATTTDQGTVTRSRTYDAVGDVLTLSDRDGRVRRFTFDNLNRQITEEWLDGSSQVIRTISSTYDAKGRLTSISDPDSSYAYTYDNLDRVTTIDNDGTSNAPHVVLTQHYDLAGRRTSLESTVGGTADFTNNYTYDDLDRLTRVTQSGTGIAAKRVDFTYRADGSYDTITRYADLSGTSLASTSTYGYDSAGRLTSLTHARNATTLAAYTWTYDASGRITAATSPDGSVSYAYDANGQLTAADNSTLADESYSYDESGNRTTSGYATGDDNRLTSDGTYNYEYDAEGNRTKRTTISSGAWVEYAYDYRNRLTNVTFKNSSGTVTGRVRYTYDALDRRIAKEIDANADNTYETVERYSYNGDNIVLVHDGSGSLKSRYLHGQGQDQALAEETSTGAVRWELADEQGSVRDIADSSGSILNHIVYDSFGNVLSQSASSVGFRYGYTGREYDGESGLWYFRHRYYDASVGRFISQDPIGFGGGDDNLYRYVGNSTPNLRDPSGLSAQETAEASGDEEGPVFLEPADDTTSQVVQGGPKVGEVRGDGAVFRGYTIGNNEIWELPPEDGKVWIPNAFSTDPSNGSWEDDPKLQAKKQNDELNYNWGVIEALGDDINAALARDLKMMGDYYASQAKRYQWEADNAKMLAAGDVMNGYFVKAPQNVMSGAYNMIRHPFVTAENIANGIEHLITDPVGDDQRGRGSHQGEGADRRRAG